jgi:tetratricopeptide (TPR) repeat protein
MHDVLRTLLMTAALALAPAVSHAQAQQGAPNPNAGMYVPASKNAAATQELKAGLVDAWMENRTEAAAHLDRALELEPTLAVARALRSQVVGGPTALAEAQRAAIDAATSGNAVEALIALSAREATAGRAAVSRRLMNLAVEMVPNDRDIATWAAVNLADTARLNALRRVNAKFADYAPSRLFLAFYLSPLGFGVDSIVNANSAEASAVTMEAMRIAPRASLSHSIMAHVLLAQKKYAEAQQHANAAASLLPKNEYAYEILAQLAANDGNFAAERAALDSATAWDSNVGSNFLYARSRAMIALSEGNPAQAQTELAASAKKAEDMHALPNAVFAHLFAATVSAASRDSAGITMHLAAAKADSVAQGAYNDYSMSAYCIAGNGVKGRALLADWIQTNGPRATLTAAQNITPTANMHRHTACVLLNEGKAKEALAEIDQADENPYSYYVRIETLKALKNTKAADSVRTAFFAKRSFSYQSSAMPVIRYRALKK